MLPSTMHEDEDRHEATFGDDEAPPYEASDSDETLSDTEPALASTGRLECGSEVGRYVVLESIGSGAMGVVYAAYDPELDRKIALKLLRPGVAAGPSARERLLREAKAMARLAHPNVITVHDVGTVDGAIFIAMEFVDGSTLLDRQGNPDWQGTLDAYVLAGGGLAAAHRAGLVHRDFKPENVLVGEDGRVRVVDFGIARDSDEESESEAERADPSGAPVVAELATLRTNVSEGLTGPSLTRTGALMGTPAFMSPEQHLGHVAGPKSDQFSFCVALWQALLGQRPFSGENHATLAFQVCHGEIVDPPTQQVPGWIVAHLRRGLARDPEERHASMDELLDALRTPPTKRRGWIIGAMGVAFLMGAGWMVLGDREDPPCLGAQPQLEEVWSEERRERIGQRFEATGKIYSRKSWETTTTAVDDWAARWVRMKTDTCEATMVRHEQSQALMDLRMLCLDRRLGELVALLNMLDEADEAIVESAVGAVHQLGDLDACADIDHLGLAGRKARPRPAAIGGLEEQLTRAVALERASKFEEALALAVVALKGARASGHEPFIAEAQQVHAYQLGRTGDSEGAARAMLAAVLAADAAEDDRLRARALIDLVEIHGVDEGEAALARSEGELARAVLTRVGGDERLEARLDGHLGRIALHAGEGELAVELFERALELHEGVFGPRHPRVATSLSDLGTAERDLGRFDQAEAHQQRAHEIRKQLLGEGHPDVGRSLTNIGNLRHARGDYAGALEHHGEAIEVFERSLGREHVYVGKVQSNRANALLELGRHREAADAYAQSLRILESRLGTESLALAISLDNHSVALSALGRHGDAFAAGSRALEIREKALGSDHVAVATNLDNLGRILSGMGTDRLGDPEPYHVRAVEILEKNLGKEDVHLVTPLVSLGLEYMEQGRLEAAGVEIGRALEIAERHPERPANLINARDAQVRLLWAQGRRKPARQLAAMTVQEFAQRTDGETGEEGQVPLARLRGWLAQHG
jgi:tetratricopeptide (TPR) repeat protein/predicted Ser/Thr protein kinase